MSKENKRVKEFVERWKNGGREKQDCHHFWEDLIESILGVKRGRDWLNFEKDVPVPVVTTEDDQTTKWLDCYVKHSRIVIEQKSSHISLYQEQKQGKKKNGQDKDPLNAIQQAQEYYKNLKEFERGDYTIACNFKEFVVVDQNKGRNEKGAETFFTLGSLVSDKNWKFLRFVLNGGKNADSEEAQDAAAKTASGFVKQLYALLKKQYQKEELTSEVYHSMNVFCVRTVFCLYADDADVFGEEQFSKFLIAFEAPRIQEKFKWLFYRLNKKKADEMLDPEIKVFPYVNGGLFYEEVPIPRISDEVLRLLRRSTCKMTMPDGTPFHWGNISPTNFGCIFESTLDPTTRRNNGMHYTSPANIRKVIGPLFLDSLKEELEDIKNKPTNEQKQLLLDFQRKLRMTTFLDPACGSGNFLTETFKELRRLEMQAISLIPNYGFEELDLRDGDTYFKCPYVVDIDQFYGIEINDFAVEVAKTALWISHCQMVDEAEDTFNRLFDPLPLSNISNIHCADALTMNWINVTPRRKVDYIIGNPPFEGSQQMKSEQKQSLHAAMSDNIWDKTGSMDFVCGWYAKAAEYMQGSPNIKAALVSTNSITQGDHVASLWKPLTERYHAQIIFAWKSFVWESEAKDKAAVHCVIIGFCCRKTKLQTECYLYDEYGRSPGYDRLNAYLLPAEQFFLCSQQKHIQEDAVPQMQTGSMPNDQVEIEDKSSPTGKRKVGMLRMSAEERKKTIEQYPELEPYLPRIFGGEDFISDELTYCIWMDESAPNEIRNHPALQKRFNMIRETRRKSNRKQTHDAYKTPFMFGEIRQPSQEYLLIPATSSENRDYIPMGYVSPDIIVSKQALHIENCPKWVFAVLESRLHMAWVKVVSGRLKSDYRYSSLIVYNNFPWPQMTDKTKTRLNETASSLLAKRDKEMIGQKYEDIYDKKYIPSPEYVNAIEANEKAVFEAYAPFGITQSMSDEDIAITLLRESVRISKQKKHNKKK